MEEPQLTATATDNISKLTQIFRTAENILSEAYFYFEEDGIVIQGADPAMVGLIKIKVKADYFDKYELEEEFETAFNIEDLYDTFKTANNDEKLVLKYGEGEEEEFLLTEIHNDDFTIKSGHNYINLSQDNVPSVDGLDDFTCKFQLSTKRMKRFLNSIKSRGDSVTMTATEEQVGIDVTVGDRSRYEQIKAEFNDIQYEEFEEETKSMFSVDYLYNLFTGRRLPSLTDNVHVRMGNDFPMSASFENENFSFKFLLAPRIEEE